MSEALSDSSLDQATSDHEMNIAGERGVSSTEGEQQSSTLIEFPGVTRAVPEWRKQLSQRVREVQERRAREAAEAAAMKLTAESVSGALPSAQLELVPDREHPAMNPIVSRVLERLERARQPELATAAAPALAPVEDQPASVASEFDGNASRKSRLVVVSPAKNLDEP